MSIQSEIDRIITAVGAAYDAVEAKGGTLPTSETVANLAEAISSIPKDTHQTAEQATPSLSLNAATGVVTAEATQAAGLVAAGTKTATMQLATQAARTVTPSAAQQTAVASGKYTTGDVVVAAVPTEANTVELSMPSGDQTVSPSSGKFLSAVTVKKPATMLPENIKKGVSIGGVVGTLEGGGGDIDALIKRTIREITSNVSKVGSSAFRNCSGLTTADFPQATSVGSYAFESCLSLKTVSFQNATNIGRWAFKSCDMLTTTVFPKVTSIDDNAFDGCTRLANVSFPKVATIGSTAFGNCTALETVEFPLVTSIGSYAFNSCKLLTTVEFPQATSIDSYAFSSCEKLTAVSFPLVTSIDSYAFSSCEKLTAVSFPLVTSISEYTCFSCSVLTTADFPQATSIGGGAFGYCSALATASFPKATSIGANAFGRCSVLTALVLGNTEAICRLSATNAFTSTPIASGTGYIYVPDALVDSYKTANNWKTYAAQIKPLSEYSA